MEDIKEKLDKGYVHSRVIIEVLGKPKGHVEESIKRYIEKIKKEELINVLTEEIMPATEQDKMWSAFAELEILAKDLPTLAAFCFEYMPSSVEILAPEEKKIKCSEISGIFNDLQLKLHNVDMVVKNLRAESGFLKRNMKTILTNLIKILLVDTGYPLDKLSGLTGVPEKELENFLNTLMTEKIVIKKENDYALVLNNEQ